MAFKHLLLAFLVLGVIEADKDFEVGLDSEEILNTEFKTEDSDDNRTIDEIIKAAGTVKGAALSAAASGEVNYQMDMNMDPKQYASVYGSIYGLYAGAGMASSYYRWPKGIIPYKIRKDFSKSQLDAIYSGMRMWMRKTCIKFERYGRLKLKPLATTITLKSSAEMDATPPLVTTIILTKSHSKLVVVHTRALLLMSLATLSVFTTNNAV